MDTFAIDTISAPQASASSALIPVQAGLGNAGVGRAPQAAGIQFDTGPSGLESLLKFGQKFLEPKIEQMRKKQTLNGAVQAMQGQTAAEMSKGDIFGGIFGDPTAVAAARQVEKLNGVTNALTEVQVNMDEWKKKTPDEFRAMLPELMSKHLTGDDMSDSLITQGFIQQMPGLVEHHTKASIAHQNTVALNTYGDRMRGALNWMQSFADARSKDPTSVTEDGVRAAAAWTMNEIASGIGMLDEKAAGKMAYNVTRQMAAEGKFDALELLVNSPITQIMSPDQQAMLPTVIEKAKTDYYLNNPQFAGINASLGQFKAAVKAGVVSSGSVIKWYDARVKDGTAKMLDLDNKWLAGQIEIAHSQQFARAKALAKEGEKGPSVAHQVQAAAAAGQDMRLSGVTQKERQEASDSAWKDTPPEKRAAVLSEYAKVGMPYPSEQRMAMGAAMARVAQVGVLSSSDIGQLTVAYQLYKLNPSLAISEYRESPEAIKVLTLLDSNPDVFSGDPKVADEARRTVGSLLVASKNLPPPSPLEAKKAITAELKEPFWQMFLPNTGFQQKNAFIQREGERLHSIGVPAKMSVEIAESNFAKSTDRVLSMPVLGNPGSGPTFRNSVAQVAAGRYGKSHGASTISDKQYDLAMTQAIKVKLLEQRPKFKGTPTVMNAIYTSDGSLQLFLSLNDGAATVPLILNAGNVAAQLLELLAKPKAPPGWEKDLDALINP